MQCSGACSVLQMASSLPSSRPAGLTLCRSYSLTSGRSSESMGIERAVNSIVEVLPYLAWRDGHVSSSLGRLQRCQGKLASTPLRGCSVNMNKPHARPVCGGVKPCRALGFGSGSSSSSREIVNKCQFGFPEQLSKPRTNPRTDLSKQVTRSHGLSEGPPDELQLEDKFVKLEEDVPAFGPTAMLLVGFSVDDVTRVKKMLKDMNGEFVRILICTTGMLRGTLGRAVMTEQTSSIPPTAACPTAEPDLPRVCILSGLTGEEIMIMVDAFSETGINPPPIFGALVPGNLEKPMLEVLEEMVGDHDRLVVGSSSLEDKREQR